MKTVEIQADSFFNLLKSKEVSMWQLFGEMIDGEEKQLLFIGPEEKIIASYVLPATREQLEKDVETFQEDLLAKLSAAKK